MAARSRVHRAKGLRGERKKRTSLDSHLIVAIGGVTLVSPPPPEKPYRRLEVEYSCALPGASAPCRVQAPLAEAAANDPLLCHAAVRAAPTHFRLCTTAPFGSAFVHYAATPPGWQKKPKQCTFLNMLAHCDAEQGAREPAACRIE